MEAANCSLRVKRPLLDPRFEGYKLSLEPLPCYQLELDAGGIGGALSHAVPFRLGCHGATLCHSGWPGVVAFPWMRPAGLHLERPFPESGTHAGTRGTTLLRVRASGPWALTGTRSRARRFPASPAPAGLEVAFPSPSTFL